MQKWYLIASVFMANQLLANGPAISHDVVIYGGTSAGVAAAVQTARMGKSVVLIEPGGHLGGLTAGGLGATDIGKKEAIGGIAREFYGRVYRHYNQDEAWVHQQRGDYKSRRQAAGEETMWTFEPHVAEAIFTKMLRELDIEVVFNERLDLNKGVQKDGSRITSIVMESGRQFPGARFIDTTYEGDLMAVAGVSYHVGRESNATYDETINGVQLGSQKHQFHVEVDPYVVPGDPSSGLLPGIHPGGPGEHGEGDHRVQAYCFRMCLTDVPENRIAFRKPAGYEPLRYELALRTILAGQWDGLGNPLMMPNRKTDTNNNGAFSTDNIGMNYAFPDGDYATRDEIQKEHTTYQQGWLWFLANDPRVPESIRAEVGQWGLAKDEFIDNDGWPHQLYVREARRMISDVVMTEHHCWGDQVASDPVGLAAYGMDSHNTQRYAVDGRVLNEGDVQVHGFAPYPIAYRSIVPKEQECENLLVPVCLSASHIAYGSIRMEPVFMVLGQSAATAACQSIDQECSVQGIDAELLEQRLLEDHQVLTWTGPRPYRGKRPRDLAGIVVDDTEAELVGGWSTSRSVGGFVGRGYSHDGKQRIGKKQATFTAQLPESGRYKVLMSYTSNPNRASAAKVRIVAADGEHVIHVDQRSAPPIDDMFIELGHYDFSEGTPAEIIVSNEEADGYVVVDAFQLIREEK